jgi:hypothetical protein
LCGIIAFPTHKQQSKNNPNQKSKQIQSHKCGVQFQDEDTYTKNKKQTGHNWIKKKKRKWLLRNNIAGDISSNSRVQIPSKCNQNTMDKCNLRQAQFGLILYLNPNKVLFNERV